MPIATVTVEGQGVEVNKAQGVLTGNFKCEFYFGKRFDPGKRSLGQLPTAKNSCWDQSRPFR